MNWWVILGFVGQAAFFMRMLIQWIASERRGESFIPIYFWYLSLSGGLILFIYAIRIGDPVFILGQSCGVLVYTRNLMLIYRKNNKVKKNQNLS